MNLANWATIQNPHHFFEKNRRRISQEPVNTAASHRYRPQGAFIHLWVVWEGGDVMVNKLIAQATQVAIGVIVTFVKTPIGLTVLIVATIFLLLMCDHIFSIVKLI